MTRESMQLNRESIQLNRESIAYSVKANNFSMQANQVNLESYRLTHGMNLNSAITLSVSKIVIAPDILRSNGI